MKDIFVKLDLTRVPRLDKCLWCEILWTRTRRSATPAGKKRKEKRNIHVKSTGSEVMAGVKFSGRGKKKSGRLYKTFLLTKVW